MAIRFKPPLSLRQEPTRAAAKTQPSREVLSRRSIRTEPTGNIMGKNKKKESSIVRVSLTDTILRDSLLAYVDETKPDPLVRQELEAIQWTWKDDENTVDTEKLLPEATHCLAGTAEWTGSYASVALYVQTCWKTDGDCKEGEKAKNGSLVAVCHVTGRLEARKSDADVPTDKKAAKAQKRIDSRMIERLEKDDYIAKHLLKNGERQQLYEARIIQTAGDLEERVDTTPDVAEAMRRAVFFSAEDSLDVLEVILAMPWLPVVKHAPSQLTKDQTTALADRARLRLLEDAMCDACEQQGEEVMVQDLDIGISATKKAKKE